MKTSSSIGILFFLCVSVTELCSGNSHPVNVTSAEAEFLRVEVNSGTFLAIIARHAEKHASREEVKIFAGKLAVTQENMMRELMKIAQSRNIPIHIELESSETEFFERLQRDRGDFLDWAFLSAVIKDCKECVQAHALASRSACDHELRIWSAKFVPMLTAQLKEARDLSSLFTITVSIDNPSASWLRSSTSLRAFPRRKFDTSTKARSNFRIYALA